MRLSDVLQRGLAGVRVVVDTTDTDLDLEPYLVVPEEVQLRQDSPPAPIGAGMLAVSSYGPDPRVHGDLDSVTNLLARLDDGGRAVIAFGYPSAELPHHTFLDALVANYCQLLWAATLDYDHLLGAVLLERTKTLLPLRDWAGQHVPHEPATSLRLADEFVLTDFVARGQRRRIFDLETRSALPVERGAVEGAQEARRQAIRERDAATRELEGARDRMELLEGRVAMLQASTSMRLGQALVSAVRSPRRVPTALPRQLYGFWRDRSHVSGSRSVGGVAESSTAADNSLFLEARSLRATPRDSLVISGILRPETSAVLSNDAVVNRLLPHDATVITERTAPDVVVFQASVCSGYGPWALVGTNTAPDLDRRLEDLLALTRSLGRPAVLWRDVPAAAAPGLQRFGWTSVLDDADTGVTYLDPHAMDRESLRYAFLTCAPRVRLGELARLAQAPDPLEARRVAVITNAHDRREQRELIRQVLDQRHLPSELVLDRGSEGWDELLASGIELRVGAPTVPWVADWTDLTRSRRPNHLLDLVCAQECTGADVVGFVTDHDNPDDYVFVPQVDPGLVRSTLHQTQLPSTVWSRRGHRLLAIQEELAA